MAKILHLATDEKFISAADYLYEKAFPGQNVFFIVLPSKKSYKIRYVEKKEHYFFFKDGKQAVKEISGRLNNFDIVILHGFDLFKAQVVSRNKSVIYNWLLWGAEIYDRHHLFKGNIFGKKTKNITLKHEKRLKRIIRPIYHIIKYGIYDVWRFQHKVIFENINFLSTIHKEDFELFQNNKVIKKDTNYFRFTYYPIDFIFNNNKGLIISGDNILLGNSASKSNNHLEAIDILARHELLGDRQVIVPLSYGSKEYADIVIDYGNEHLKNNFSPLTKFMPLNEYNNVVSKCGIVVMNHYRQQAVGNILASLWMGAKVFLDERNTFFHYLRRIGCHVYSTNELIDDNLNLLSEEQIIHNRSVIFNEISADNVIAALKNDIGSIIKKSK